VVLEVVEQLLTMAQVVLAVMEATDPLVLAQQELLVAPQVEQHMVLAVEVVEQAAAELLVALEPTVVPVLLDI
jgi:hypothetical protein